MTGTWLGEYTYGPEYGDAAGTSVPFTMSLHEVWLLRQVTGRVRDDATRGGFPEPAEVQGVRRKRTVEFVKSYPEQYFVDEKGVQVSMREFLHREHGFPRNVRLPPHRVHYVGHLDEHGAAIAGTWRILPWQTEHPGLECTGGEEGTWTARRTSPRLSAM